MVHGGKTDCSTEDITLFVLTLLVGFWRLLGVVWVGIFAQWLLWYGCAKAA